MQFSQKPGNSWESETPLDLEPAVPGSLMHAVPCIWWNFRCEKGVYQSIPTGPVATAVHAPRIEPTHDVST